MNRFLYILFITTLLSCQEDKQDGLVLLNHEKEIITIPDGFPPMEFPDGNELTEDRWKLGKLLFYDKRLSIDKSISCGSCHKPAFAFTDDRAFSDGVFNRSGIRNAPSLANVGYQPYLLREGSVPTLEMQVLVPIQEHNEFNHNVLEIAKELQADSSYEALSMIAYDRAVDPYVITRALANFQRTMISGNSAYDKYVYQDNRKALSNKEKNGMELFFSSRTNCSSCHSGFNFSDYSFENNGLDSIYSDNGRQRLTNDSADEALFKVPSLRNVGLTSPYMHDGRFSALEEVIEHYNLGGEDHKHKSYLIQPLSLSQTEKDELIAFLNSLTDFDFVNDPKWEREN